MGAFPSPRAGYQSAGPAYGESARRRSGILVVFGLVNRSRYPVTSFSHCVNQHADRENDGYGEHKQLDIGHGFLLAIANGRRALFKTCDSLFEDVEFSLDALQTAFDGFKLFEQRSGDDCIETAQ